MRDLRNFFPLTDFIMDPKNPKIQHDRHFGPQISSSYLYLSTQENYKPGFRTFGWVVAQEGTQ